MNNEIEQLYKFIIETQNETEKRLKLNIKNRVYEAHAIASKLYEENKNSKSKDEIKKLIKDSLVDIKFNDGRGYYFIYSMNYECILLPVDRSLEGSDFYNFKDGKDEYTIRRIVDQLKKEKEGFLTWYYHKPDDMENQYKKIGFNIYFKPLNWFIGTGEYFTDYEKEVKKEILNYIKKLSTNENSTYFILDYNKNILFHNNNEYINEDISKVDFFNDDEKVIKDIIEVAKNGEGFISYIPKHIKSTDIGSTKNVYVKGLQNWKWAIGKGFYKNEITQLFEKKEKELNKNFSKNLLTLFYISVTVTILLLIFSLYMGKLLEKKFSNYKKAINEYMTEKSRQHHILAQQSKMASMGEMIGNIAHQWRQPLSIITTAATGMKMKKEFKELDDESFYDSVDNITNTAKYLSKTIDDFRNFFKSDKTETFFTINEAFEKTFKLTDAQFKNKEIEFIINIETFEIYGLENELLQSFINILNNAKDALENKKENKYIFIDTFVRDNIGIIKIKDTGGGIDEKIINKICEPYFTTKHSSNGTGIGLYMTQEIIRNHMKGKFIIENIDFEYMEKQYTGAQFTIELKLSTSN